MNKTVIRTDNHLYFLDMLQYSKEMPWHHYPNLPGEKVTIEFVHEDWNGDWRDHWKVTVMDKRDDVTKILNDNQ